MTYLRILAVVLMILGVFVLLSIGILCLRAHFSGAPAEQLLLFGSWAVVGPGLLVVTASLLEWLAASAARRRRLQGEPLLPVRWGAASDRFGAGERGEGIYPEEPGVRE